MKPIVPFESSNAVTDITKPIRMSKNGKTDQSARSCESYHEGGKVKNRTAANLTRCKPEEIAALEFALQHKGDLPALTAGAPSLELREGHSVGTVWTIAHMAKRLDLEKALSVGWPGRLALWQVLARVPDPGSRLSSVRLAQTHAVGGAQQFLAALDIPLPEVLPWRNVRVVMRRKTA